MDFFSPVLVKKYKDILKATPQSTAFLPFGSNLSAEERLGLS